MESTFARVIEEHLELKRRNAELDGMPLDRYKVDDPFQNHPLFKSEEQARLEDTLSGSEPDADSVSSEHAWGLDEREAEPPEAPEDTFWGRSRDFDWGD